MPVYKCDGENKWRIGTGPCIYTSKKNAEKAYRGYLMKIAEKKGSNKK